MSLRITQATVEDAELLATMRLEMRRERETAVLQISEGDFLQRNLLFFRDHLSDGSFLSFSAWDGEQAAACSGLSLEIHPPTYANPSGRLGYVTNMYTHPAWRHQGLARVLLDKVVEAARAAGCAQVSLNASPMGRQLYVRYGFQPVDGEMKLSRTPAEKST